MLILTTSVPVTRASKEDDVVLERVLYIYYLLHFWKNTVEAKTLINSSNKVNIMIPAYASKLDLRGCHTNIGVQKINRSTLEIFEMVLTSFQIEDKFGKAWFFQKTFLLANISVKVILRISFLTLSNTDIQFAKKKLISRSYIAAKALPTTKQVELINKKEFAKVALDENVEAFVIYVTFLSLSSISIYLAKEA